MNGRSSHRKAQISMRKKSGKARTKCFHINKETTSLLCFGCVVGVIKNWDFAKGMGKLITLAYA